MLVRTRPWIAALPMALAVAVIGTSLVTSKVEAAVPNITFTVSCKYSHSLPDDPIVYPKRAGASHMHDFFGNTSTNADSSPGSLTGSPAATCSTPTDASAYWIPAMYDNGTNVLPSDAKAYYHAGGKDHRKIQAPPAGLMILTKNTGQIWFMCAGGTSSRRTRSVPLCGSNQHLVQIIHFPDCWDRKRLDSPDHQSHMSFSYSGQCPSGYAALPQIRMYVNYRGFRGGSGVTFAPVENPSKPHADFMNGWDQAALERVTSACINAGKACDRFETETIAAGSSEPTAASADGGANAKSAEDTSEDAPAEDEQPSHGYPLLGRLLPGS